MVVKAPGFGDRRKDMLKDIAIYGDLVAEGVIDPTKVVRSALQNAASVAGLMLTTECLVAEKPKDDKGADARAGHNHGGGY